MSTSPIDRSPDLQRLQEEGYEVELKSGHVLLRSVPYVTRNCAIERGTLVTELNLAGDVTSRPRTHVAMFTGEYPCDESGSPILQIRHSEKQKDLGGGLTINHSFSSKPQEGYADYYQLLTTYEAIISSPAQIIDPNATARTFAVLPNYSEFSEFEYADTASSRSGVAGITDKLRIGPVAIVGLGGTGSYILDLVAKTPVAEVHLFDEDRFGQHNAFRSPGAPPIDVLQAAPLKSQYFKQLYAPMRRRISAHGHVDESTAEELKAMEFVFVAVDSGRSRKFVIETLEEFDVPYIDVGMGITETDGSLRGQLRVSANADRQFERTKTTLPISDDQGDDEYAHNIQIADLNAFNAAMAVIKWKKSLGFYLDLENECFSAYQIDGNLIVNDLIS